MGLHDAKTPGHKAEKAARGNLTDTLIRKRSLDQG